MSLKSTWHLCQQCKDEPWEQDPVIRTMNTLEQEKPVEHRNHCGDTSNGNNCERLPEHACFSFCYYHAEKAQKCQHCNKTTLNEEEQANAARAAVEQENLEEAIDFFTLLKKSYGITVAKKLVAASDLWNKNIREEIERLKNDPNKREPGPRFLRPVWRKVLGGETSRYCQNCPPPSPKHPDIGRAEKCEHLVVGQKAEWCALCAADRFLCEICGVSVK